MESLAQPSIKSLPRVPVPAEETVDLEVSAGVLAATGCGGVILGRFRTLSLRTRVHLRTYAWVVDSGPRIQPRLALTTRKAVVLNFVETKVMVTTGGGMGRLQRRVLQALVLFSFVGVP